MPPRNHHNLRTILPTPLRNEPDTPSSPRSPLTPIRPRRCQTRPSTLNPPPPLHLRPLISTPSPTRTHIHTHASRSSTPPPTPLPWVWFCHLCNRRYDLSATRRCLEDGHYFCSRPAPSPSPSPELTEAESESIFDGDEMSLDLGIEGVNGMTPAEQIIEKARLNRQKKQRNRKRRRVRSCRSEFDYDGWGGYAGWQAGYWGWEDDEAEMEHEGNNCWNQCTFPSECHNRRQEEREREWFLQREEQEIEEERLRAAARSARTARSKSAARGDKGAEMVNSMQQWVRDWEVRANGGGGDVEGLVREAHLLVEMADVRTTTIEYGSDDDGDDGAPYLTLEIPGGEVFDFHGDGDPEDGQEEGPLGIDCDGLGEGELQLEYAERRQKRKSMDRNGEKAVSPSSPLKEEFSLGEVGRIEFSKIEEVDGDEELDFTSDTTDR